MSSTLADLQRLNIKKMEDAEPPQDAAAINPSNEVSIIPSSHQLNENFINASNEEVSEVSSEAIITPLSTPSRRPDKHPAARSKHKKPASAAPLPNASLSSGSKAVRVALEAQIREHLIEQLMPQNGKGPVTRLNVEMPEDMHQQLKQHCVQTRTPIKGLINALIAWYLETEGKA